MKQDTQVALQVPVKKITPTQVKCLLAPSAKHIGTLIKHPQITRRATFYDEFRGPDETLRDSYINFRL